MRSVRLSLISSVACASALVGGLAMPAGQAFAAGSSGSSFLGSSFLGSSSDNREENKIVGMPTINYPTAEKPQDADILTALDNFDKDYATWYSTKGENMRDEHPWTTTLVRKPILSETLRGYAQAISNSDAAKKSSTDGKMIQHPDGSLVITLKWTPSEAALKDSNAILNALLNNVGDTIYQMAAKTVSQYGLGIAGNADDGYYLTLYLNNDTKQVFRNNTTDSVASTMKAIVLVSGLNEVRKEAGVTSNVTRDTNLDSKADSIPTGGTLANAPARTAGVSVAVLDRSKAGVREGLIAAAQANQEVYNIIMSGKVDNAWADVKVGVSYDDSGNIPYAKYYFQW
ncbi:MAG: hypothetical protein Q3962_06435 [Corynebacterium sp.]|nr:hypothetical protein [Corynebacterium sp.]